MSRTWSLLLFVPMVAAAFAAACGGDDDAGGSAAPAPDGGGGTDSTAPSDASSTEDTGPNPTKDSGPPEQLTFTTYASFSPQLNQLPEGLVVLNGTPIITFAPTGQLFNVLPDGGLSLFGAHPSPSNTYTLGLTLGPTNDVFNAVAVTGASPKPTPGVYKFISSGGAPGAYDTGGTATFGFTNGLDFIGTDLFASDSSGKIIKIANTGFASDWKVDEQLAGDVTACGSKNGFPIGVNGISHDDDFVYGVNLDKGTFFRIKRNANGTAGALEILLKTCDFFGGDGIFRDTDGSFIVANNAKNRIDRVTLGTNNASYKTIASGAPLDGPASVFIDGTAPNRKLWVTNSAFGSAATDGGTPKPSLVFAPIK